jgi:hypothetical protein
MKIKKWTKWMILGGTAWVFLTFIAFIHWLPSIPYNPRQWLVLVIIGPPIMLLGELLAGSIGNSKNPNKPSGHANQAQSGESGN